MLHCVTYCYILVLHSVTLCDIMQHYVTLCDIMSQKIGDFSLKSGRSADL